MPSRPCGIAVQAPSVDAIDVVLPPATQAFVTELVRRFRPRIAALLERRRVRQSSFDAGVMPWFLAETAAVRQRTWWIPAVPPELQDRRVEIVGPADRHGLAADRLSAGANVFVADFEDTSVPTWAAVIDGQRNLLDAVRGRTPRTAVLMVRPRGLHLFERHFEVDGRPVPAALFDFGVFFVNNAIELLRRGSAPYLYLAKLESHLEARMWNDAFSYAERAVGLLIGTIRATVSIETLPAAFEMDEILLELRPHAAGLSWDRWDFLFSAMKTRRRDPTFLLPDRAQIGMHTPSLRACAGLLIQTCHRRRAHAIGPMAAEIPSAEGEWNPLTLARVRDDKTREAIDGHDGTWVAHSGLVAIVREVLDARIPLANQIEVESPGAPVTVADLLVAPAGTRTEAGLREHVVTGIRYLLAWQSGSGFVPIDGEMADAAAMEVSRALVWQWLRHGGTLADGRTVTRSLVQRIVADELGALSVDSHCETRSAEAARLFERLATSDELDDFGTVAAYDALA